ncbi:MAG: SpoIIIAH-like family protein [Clostridiales bacterium]|nr:SpoIIIAH-like family protein [Clostridiales bacterium]
MLSKKKKIFILAGMVVLLVVTGYVNVLLSNKAKQAQGQGNITQTGNFFSTYRADRQTTRDQTMAYLTAIIDSQTSSEEAKAEAETQKLKLTKVMQLELAVEAIILSKGFADCVVTAGTENINVIVKKAELTEDEATQILDAVVSESGKEPRYVKIIPVE